MVSLISFMQVGVNWLNYFMIFCLLAVYVKNTVHQPRAKLKFRLSLVVYLAWGVIGFSLITFAFLLVEGSPDMAPKTSGIYNKVLGLTGTVSIILQWSPQIVTTFLHKGPGALSPITLSINSPGSLLTAISLVASGKSFSLWLPYVLSGAQQAVIVALILYFYCTRGKKAPLEEILEHDPGFQGPALLLEDSDSSSASSSGSDGDEDDGLVGGGRRRRGGAARTRSASGHRFHSDSEAYGVDAASTNSYSAFEEYGEEDTEDDADGATLSIQDSDSQGLLRRKPRRSAAASAPQQPKPIPTTTTTTQQAQQQEESLSISKSFPSSSDSRF